MRILLVDDDPISLEMAANVLRPHYDVETAIDGREAWERVRSDGFDLVVTDWMMPGMDGIELCHRIRKAASSYTHVIILTSRESSEDAVRALETGADEFVRKPVDPSELQARVRSILRLRELNREIARQNEQLVRAQQLRKDWTSMIVHDLRSPLTAVQGFCQLLQAQIQDSRGYLARILRESERVGRMLEDMLVMAKSEDGKLVLARTRFDLADLIRNQLSKLEVLFSSHELDLRVDPPRTAMPVNMDRSLVRRIIDNLVSNAVKFSPAGSRVTVELSTQDGRVRFVVLDEGLGVPEELRERIFERFETGAQLQGVAQCGLGLAFCRLVVEAHGGTIRYRARSRGSCFEVTMPQQRALTVSAGAGLAE